MAESPTLARPTGIDPNTYRDVLARFVTGVTVVTTLENPDGERQPWGTTVNSFTGISLEPPLVMVSIGRERSIHPIIERTARFAVNILGETSQALSDCFAGAPSTLPREAFCNAEYALGTCGLPILGEAIAYVGCQVDQRIEAGDHTIYLGRVVEAGTRDESGWPLLYFRRRYLRIERAEPAEMRGKPDKLR
ncbi:MAG TPA: flavin reductase family protein [Candidatus Limnocylindria bacterium]|jgi:flavin reductase (DIM6/NTAB) family NADH-FMN oxidoreductase RutF|nr:flavin reductase family protein [Candidatus Limnocylindria bacterium]